MGTIKGGYSDYMDDELPTPNNDWAKILTHVIIFGAAIILVAIGIFYITSNPK